MFIVEIKGQPDFIAALIVKFGVLTAALGVDGCVQRAGNTRFLGYSFRPELYAGRDGGKTIAVRHPMFNIRERALETGDKIAGLIALVPDLGDQVFTVEITPIMAVQGKGVSRHHEGHRAFAVKLDLVAEQGFGIHFGQPVALFRG